MPCAAHRSSYIESPAQQVVLRLTLVVLTSICNAMTAGLARCMASSHALCCASWATSPRTRLQPSTLCPALRASPGLDPEVSSIFGWQRRLWWASALLSLACVLVQLACSAHLLWQDLRCCHREHCLWYFCCCTLLTRGACLQVPICRAYREQHPSHLR